MGHYFCGVTCGGKLRLACQTCVDGLIGCAPGQQPLCSNMHWLVRGQLFYGFGLLFSDCFAILCAYGDSRSLMGGSDVARCVQVLVTGTVVAWFLGV